jgi:hypothetical protein
MATYLQRWETAKTKFTNATGEKKPKPTGFFNSFFNHTGLTSALKDADAVAAQLSAGATKPEDMPKVLAKGDDKFAKLSREITEYLKILDKDAKMEKADNNAKTDLYRNLKVLSAELKAIDAAAGQLLEGTKIARERNLSSQEKAGKMIKTALKSACANAVLAVKKVQAAPTYDTFTELFATHDTPGRKIQVQLVAARNQNAAGKLKTLTVDPGTLADRFNPWQGQTTPKNVLPADATKQDVIARLEEFKGLLKLAVKYSEEL